MKTITIKTKQEFCWHFVDVYLEMLSQVCITYEDKVFFEKLCDLKNYLDEKLKLESDGDVIERYVTVVQEVKGK